MGRRTVATAAAAAAALPQRLGSWWVRHHTMICICICVQTVAPSCTCVSASSPALCVLLPLLVQDGMPAPAAAPASAGSVYTCVWTPDAPTRAAPALQLEAALCLQALVLYADQGSHDQHVQQHQHQQLLEACVAWAYAGPSPAARSCAMHCCWLLLAHVQSGVAAAGAAAAGAGALAGGTREALLCILQNAASDGMAALRCVVQDLPQLLLIVPQCTCLRAKHVCVGTQVYRNLYGCTLTPCSGLQGVGHGQVGSTLLCAAACAVPALKRCVSVLCMPARQAERWRPMCGNGDRRKSAPHEQARADAEICSAAPLPKPLLLHFCFLLFVRVPAPGLQRCSAWSASS